MDAFNEEASRAILSHGDVVSKMVVGRKYADEPEFWERYGEEGRRKSLEDAKFHLVYLAEAIAVSDPSLFIDYVAWVKVLFKDLNFPDHVLPATLECTREALKEILPHGMHGLVDAYIDAALKQLQVSPSVVGSFIHDGLPLAGLARLYLEALLRGERHRASRLVLDAVEGGTPLRDIHLSIFQPTQYEIGRLWQMNRLSVAQEHYCTAATQLIMSQLYPYLFSTERIGKRLVATCIGGKLHEIGVRMVADFFEIEGWDTYYVGANTPVESILRTIGEQKADLLAISATMTFHIGSMIELIDRVQLSNVEKKVKILVGGYPFNISPDLWRRVGADGVARDAEEAVRVGRRLVEADPHEG
ncbi:MAG: B12-binding domain-containing protein [Acidobacteriota bacterium]